jgi:hypothetical protein
MPGISEWEFPEQALQAFEPGFAYRPVDYQWEGIEADFYCVESIVLEGRQAAP